MIDLVEQLKKQAAQRDSGSAVAFSLSSIGTFATSSSTTADASLTPLNNPPQQQNAIQPLRLGDFDKKSNNQVRYDGQTFTAQPNQTYNEVDTLQENLRTIGLAEIVGTSDGDYGGRTAIAVAIFQGFALVKTRDDTANNVTVPLNFTGQVTGNADAVTRTALRRYVNENFVLPAQSLKTRLTTLGFGSLVGTVDNTYNWHTYFAVREFQIFSKMANVAEAPQNLANNQPLGDQYQQVANNQQYTGSVNGVLDVTTDDKISHWENNRWRCPLIMEAWNMSSGNRNTLSTENFWLHNEMTNTGPRVFARDLSGYYTLPAARQNDTRVVVGAYSAYAGWGGPVSLPRYHHTWSPESEFLPDNCTGSAWNAMTTAQQSTFRAIRSICERESLGYFDCMNAYDRAVVSAGPYHWTICILGSAAPHRPDNGELMAFLAMLRSNYQNVYEQYFEYYGVRPDHDWGANGTAQFSSSSHKYSDWIKLQITATDYVTAPKVAEIGNYFRVWPWFYRVQMMCRLSGDVHQEMWTYARMRMRDIKETLWDGTTTVSDGQGATRLAKIGDYYTSEKAIAMITRWHVWSPGDMVNRGNAGTHLTNAFTNAGLTGDPSTWTDQNEQTLITELRAEAHRRNNGLGSGLDAINNWPASMPNNWNLTLASNTVGTFLDTRRSLDMDTSNLPAIAF